MGQSHSFAVSISLFLQCASQLSPIHDCVIFSPVSKGNKAHETTWSVCLLIIAPITEHDCPVTTKLANRIQVYWKQFTNRKMQWDIKRHPVPESGQNPSIADRHDRLCAQLCHAKNCLEHGEEMGHPYIRTCCFFCPDKTHPDSDIKASGSSSGWSQSVSSQASLSGISSPLLYLCTQINLPAS